MPTPITRPRLSVECADTVTAEQLAAAVEGAGEKFHALSVTAA